MVGMRVGTIGWYLECLRCFLNFFEGFVRRCFKEKFWEKVIFIFVRLVVFNFSCIEEVFDEL